MNNVTESSLLKGTHSLWFVFLLVAVNMPAVTPRVESGRALRLRTMRLRTLSPLAT